MLRNFHHHRGTFDELSLLVKDNRNLIWLSQDDAESFHPLDAAYTARIRTLLQRVAAIGIRQDGASGAFTIVYDRHGTAWSKEYVYREGNPGPDPVEFSGRGRTVERPIAANWAVRLVRFN